MQKLPKSVGSRCDCLKFLRRSLALPVSRSQIWVQEGQTLLSVVSFSPLSLSHALAPSLLLSSTQKSPGTFLLNAHLRFPRLRVFVLSWALHHCSLSEVIKTDTLLSPSWLIFTSHHQHDHRNHQRDHHLANIYLVFVAFLIIDEHRSTTL